MSSNVSSTKHGMVFTVLIVLAALSLGTMFLKLSPILHNVVVFGIAVVMAVLVLLQYMGLRWEGPFIYVLFFIPFVLFAILVTILIPEFSWNHTIFSGSAPPSGH